MVRATVSAEIARAAKAGNAEPLYHLLWVSSETKAGGFGLPGLGETPFELTDEETAAVRTAAEEIDEAGPEDRVQ